MSDDIMCDAQEIHIFCILYNKIAEFVTSLPQKFVHNSHKSTGTWKLQK